MRCHLEQCQSEAVEHHDMVNLFAVPMCQPCLAKAIDFCYERAVRDGQVGAIAAIGVVLSNTRDDEEWSMDVEARKRLTGLDVQAGGQQ